jgi:hypothetical protein
MEIGNAIKGLKSHENRGVLSRRRIGKWKQIAIFIIID